MAVTLIQFPGGKSGQFKRIQSLMPDHECFVEGFGGSGVVTLNKEPAEVDVYNDLDEELVHFFIVFREATDRLCNWLDDVPYSCSQYEDFVNEFYGKANEAPPEDNLPGQTLTDNLVTGDDISYNNVRRAGIFFFLRYSQFGAKYHGRAGFGRSKVQNGAQTYANARERLRDFSGSWDHVTIECGSYEELIEVYDGEKTLYYFDPPYLGTEGYYRKSDFSHETFIEHLKEIDGYVIVSYDDLPEELERMVAEEDRWNKTVEESTNFIDSGIRGSGTDTIETVVTNFDPRDEAGYHSQNQSSLHDLTQTKEYSENGEEETITLFDLDKDEDEDTDTVMLFDDVVEDDPAEDWLDNAD